jgi:2-desacetyl-2-hydroxyethyl bacteriochlorophyllide A dehydrogenase
MRYLRCESPGHLAYGDEDISPARGAALLRITRTGICGTDLHAFEGTQPYFTYPRILGHELAAVIESVDPSSGFRAGERVTVLPYLSCGECHMCRGGETNACVSMRVCGVHVDGGMREYFEVPPANLLRAGSLTDDQLALVEPLAVGAHAVRRAGVKEGDHVVVIGAGPIGIATVLFAKLAGARVVVIDVNPWRLEHCSFISGIETFKGTSQEAAPMLMDRTEGRMPSIVIDATGNLAAINDGFRLLGHGSTYVLVGLQKEPISFSHPEFHKREAMLMSSRNATRSDFEFVMEAISAKCIDPLPMITQRIAFASVAMEFPRLLAPGSRVMKAMIEF